MKEETAVYNYIRRQKINKGLSWTNIAMHMGVSDIRCIAMAMGRTSITESQYNKMNQLLNLNNDEVMNTLLKYERYFNLEKLTSRNNFTLKLVNEIMQYSSALSLVKNEMMGPSSYDFNNTQIDFSISVSENRPTDVNIILTGKIVTGSNSKIVIPSSDLSSLSETSKKLLAKKEELGFSFETVGKHIEVSDVNVAMYFLQKLWLDDEKIKKINELLLFSSEESQGLARPLLTQIPNVSLFHSAMNSSPTIFSLYTTIVLYGEAIQALIYESNSYLKSAINDNIFVTDVKLSRTGDSDGIDTLIVTIKATFQ